MKIFKRILHIIDNWCLKVMLLVMAIIIGGTVIEAKTSSDSFWRIFTCFIFSLAFIILLKLDKED